MSEAAVKEPPIMSRQIRVGDVPVGGGAKIAVQSMTNTMTYDVEATVQQVYDLNAVGADLVRVSVNGSKALKSFKRSRLALADAPHSRHPPRLSHGARRCGRRSRLRAHRTCG
jgi:hypothetical protein